MSDDNVIPLRPPGEGLLQLPECPVTNCDHCGKHFSEGADWIQKGYGCSLCRGTDPHTWIRDFARLREAALALVESTWAKRTIESLSSWGLDSSAGRAELAKFEALLRDVREACGSQAGGQGDG